MAENRYPWQADSPCLLILCQDLRIGCTTCVPRSGSADLPIRQPQTKSRTAQRLFPYARPPRIRPDSSPRSRRDMDSLLQPADDAGHCRCGGLKMEARSCREDLAGLIWGAGTCCLRGADIVDALGGLLATREVVVAVERYRESAAGFSRLIAPNTQNAVVRQGSALAGVTMAPVLA